MPQPTGLSPSVQIQFSEIDRRHRLASTPIQFADMAQGAIAGAQTAEQIQDDKARREAAMKFKQLLDQGLQGMEAVYKEIGSTKLPPPQGFHETPELRLAWYGIAHEEAVKKQAADVVGRGLPHDEEGRELVKVGAMDAKEYYRNSGRDRDNTQADALSPDMEAALEKGAAAIEAREKKEGAVLPDATRQAILRESGITAPLLSHKAVRAVWESGTAGESKETKRKTAAAEGARQAAIDIRKEELADRRRRKGSKARKLTDPGIAREYLDRAGGDKEKARKQARSDGWEF